MFVCYSAAFCQLCFYNKDWIGLDYINYDQPELYTGRVDPRVGSGRSQIFCNFSGSGQQF